MPFVELPNSLLSRTEGEQRIELSGSHVREVIRDLESRFPDLRGWILDERGRLREHVNLFVGSERAPLDRELAADDEVYVALARAKAGELISHALDRLLSNVQDADDLPVRLKAKDRQAIRLAQDLLVNNLAEPPTIRALPRRCVRKLCTRSR